MNKQNELMKYIPKEYKLLVVDIYTGESEWNEVTKRWNTELVVEWENGKTSRFQTKSYARETLKEFYWPEDFKKEG